MATKSKLGGGVYLETSDAVRVPSAMTTTTKGGPSMPSRFENSYKLQPEAPFPTGAVEKQMTSILEEHLENVTYNAEECGKLSRSLADLIRDKAKLLMQTDQYKVVSFVVIGQKQSATLALSSRCIWNDKFDKRAESSFSNRHIYAVAMTYGLYHE